MWWKKKNKEHLLTIISAEDKAKCDNWMKEIGTSSLYTKHETWEDPLLVEDAPIFPVKSKMDSIMFAHRQRNNKEDKYKLIV